MKQIKSDPMYRFLILMTIASTVGLQSWRTLFNNFAVEMAGLNGNHIGVIQSIRELPGFLSLLVVYVLLIIQEHRLSALSIVLLGLGIGVTGFFPSFSGLILTTLVMSFGFHYYETTNQSLTLQYFEESRAPWVFGKQRSMAAASNIAVGLIIWVMSSFMSYTWLYLLMGIAITAAGMWGLVQHPTTRSAAPQKKKMILRKRYWLFYFLTFMAGARRQIFIAFAVFLMVKKFQFSVQEITLLFVLNNVVNYFLSPMIGKAIVRFGERKVLSLEYVSLVMIFVCYAVAKTKTMVALLYILDHIFFNFAIAIRTYFQKIADPADIASSMAVGFTINHIAAVCLPVAGGIVWMVDYRIPFIAGAVLAFISLVAVQMIRTR